MKIETNDILHIATLAGKLILENGAETYRAEDTISRICHCYGVDEVESFVTPTGIMVSVYKNGETYSLIKRIHTRSVDLNKIDKINTLSRTIQSSKLSINEVKNELRRIDNVDRYSFNTTLLFSAVSAASFSILFNGNYKDFFSAFIIGLIIKFTSIKATEYHINDFFINVICGGIVSFLAYFFTKFNIANSLDSTIIGSIMLLVPGLAITNAIRDSISGDLLAGVTRTAEAFFIAVSIAVGTGSVLSFLISTFGGV